MKHALITGVAGQDGAYLSRFLLDKGYRVYGLSKPRTPVENLKKLNVLLDKRFSLLEADLTDVNSVASCIVTSNPDEIYNLAAQSHVGVSFTQPQQTCNVNYTGYLNLLFSARKWTPKARIYQAGTSEMYGYSAYTAEKQNEETPFKPMSPYAISKVAAHWAGVNARYESNQFVSNGILFNHESPLREINFVTQKIAAGVKRIKAGEDYILTLGNINSMRDWGFAGDYVEAMWKILQNEKPDDFVIASGETHTVREFIEMAFSTAGMEMKFEGIGLEEKGYVDGKLALAIDPKFYRPNDLNYLCGDSSKARSVLEWKPKVELRQLVEMMVKQ